MTVIYMYELLTKREIKMAEYSPSSFLNLTSSWSIKTQKRTRPISSHLDQTCLVNKGFTIWPKRELFSCGNNAGNPERAHLARSRIQPYNKFVNLQTRDHFSRYLKKKVICTRKMLENVQIVFHKQPKFKMTAAQCTQKNRKHKKTAASPRSSPLGTFRAKRPQQRRARRNDCFRRLI